MPHKNHPLVLLYSQWVHARIIKFTPIGRGSDSKKTTYGGNICSNIGVMGCGVRIVKTQIQK